VSIELPRGKKRGQWQRVLIDEFGDQPRWSALIQCPDCGTHLPIPNHTISAEGQVTPSVAHPASACAWHPPGLKLLDWAPCPEAPGPLPTHECFRCGAKGRQLSGWALAGGLTCPACFQKLLGQTA